MPSLPNPTKILFNREECNFIGLLKERVHAFFKQEELSPKASGAMVLKTALLLGLSLLSYLLLLSQKGSGGVILMYALSGFIYAISIMNIAHDALHGAYLPTPKWNRILGFMMDLMGASSFYWRKEHVMDHHTFTNIQDHDADLDVPFLLRLSPQRPRYWFHRFQYLYAPLLYSLNLMRWIYFSDFRRLALIGKEKGAARPSKSEVFFLLFFKALYIFIFLAIPLLILPVSWKAIVCGYLLLLAVQGLTLTTIFQLAHIVEQVDFPTPNAEGTMENSFAKHQLATTSNFATKSRVVTFLFGGLNFQVEHHLFPHICHIYLPQIAPIVKQVAAECGLTYHESPTLLSALRSHFTILKKMGRP